MLSSWPPARLLSVIAAVVLLLVAAAVFIATHQPWLGIKFAPNLKGDGIIVEEIHAGSPNSALKVGDVVIGVAAGEQFQTLDSNLLLNNPRRLPTYTKYNQFLQQHAAVWNILLRESAELILMDGTKFEVHVVADRPIRTLPATFWLLVSNGAMSVLIVASIWVFRRNDGVTNFLFLASAAFFVSSIAQSLLVSRELTLSPVHFSINLAAGYLGTMISYYSLIVLVWRYPAPFRPFPAASITYITVAAFWVNQTLQLVELPGQAFFAPLVLAFVVLVFLSVFKLHFTRREPAARAAFLWFMLTMVACGGFLGIFFYIPMLFTGTSAIPSLLVYVVPTLAFTGFAFGIVRYRLFDLERWWLEVWLWLVGGLVVVALDIALITFFGVTNTEALGVAIIFAGWAYFPVRQWLFRRILRTSRTRLESHLPALVDTLFREASVISFADRWKELLQRVFSPMTTTILGAPMVQAAIVESGAALRVPSLDGSEAIELRHRERGSQLYHPRDAALADSMLTLTRRTAGLWDAKEEGARTERTRIMRDLHDDVASRLLTLLHGISDLGQQTQVREAIGTLRHVIYALDDHTLITLPDFLNEFQAHLRERLRHTNTVLDWQESAPLPVATLTPRERINLTRAVQEATSNCLRHAHPTRLTVNTTLEGGQLRLQICNDGIILRMEDWSLGKGVHNIKTRMAELDGQANWSVDLEKQSGQKLCCLTLSVPLANLGSS